LGDRKVWFTRKIRAFNGFSATANDGVLLTGTALGGGK
jgi:hypothetical protein